MCSWVIKVGQEVASQVKKFHKPITQGLNYTSQVLKDATVKNSGEDYVVKHIPKIIESVDEFIKSSGKPVSSFDREDLIQEAILASFEKTKKENYSEFVNHSAVHKQAVSTRLAQIEKSMDSQVQNLSLSSLNDVYTMDDAIAQVNGVESVNAVLKKVLYTLPIREDAIIRARYGLDTGKIATLEELSKRYNISKGRVRHIEKKALKRLRHPSRARVLRNEIFVTPNGTIYSLNKTANSNRIRNVEI